MGFGKLYNDFPLQIMHHQLSLCQVSQGLVAKIVDINLKNLSSLVWIWWFQKISISYHGQHENFNTPLPSEISKYSTSHALQIPKSLTCPLPSGFPFFTSTIWNPSLTPKDFQWKWFDTFTSSQKFTNCLQGFKLWLLRSHAFLTKWLKLPPIQSQLCN